MLIGVVCGTLRSLRLGGGLRRRKAWHPDRLFARRSRVSSLLLVRPADTAADCARRLSRPRRHRLGTRVCDERSCPGRRSRCSPIAASFWCRSAMAPPSSRLARRCSGLILASLMLHEKATSQRIIGGAIIIAGLLVFGAESLATIGGHGVGGDLLFATAGLFWATFGTLLRLWNVPGTRAVAAVGAVSMICLRAAACIFVGYGLSVLDDRLARKSLAGRGAGRARRHRCRSICLRAP